MNVYKAIGEAVPAFLHEPVKEASDASAFTQPCGILDVHVDGRVSNFFEWSPAGKFVPTGERGVMDSSAAQGAKAVFFGFGAEHVFLRLDFRTPASKALAADAALRITFTKPSEQTLLATGLTEKPRLNRGAAAGEDIGNIAVGDIVEIAMPCAVLGFKGGDDVSFFLELKSGPSSERYPSVGLLSMKLPGKDYEMLNWEA
jgi:hypothetical protein